MNWLVKKSSAYWRLTRMDKPIGILLLLWPTLWALWFASAGKPDVKVLAVFVLGTVLMRAAGCVMNDMADRNFDGHVARTRQRPLATGEVSVKEALLLAIALSLIAFALVMQLNKLTVLLSFPALFLAGSYPLTKRFIAIPQAYLGVAFGFGIPMAYAAQTGSIPGIAWLLLLGNVFWAIAYDTEYAMVDRADDLKIGIRSSAVFFGSRDVAAIMLSYGVLLGVLLLTGRHYGLDWPYYLGLTIAAMLAGYHYLLIRERQPARCFKAFLHNNWLGAVVFFGLVASYALHFSS
jgi:4-hydroxybenzoate polyprenyltransferase